MSIFYTSKFSFPTPFTLQLEEIDGDGEEEEGGGVGKEGGKSVYYELLDLTNATLL